MPEEDESQGPGIGGLISRKIGPLPMWSWLLLAGGVGLIIYRMKGGKSTSSTGGVSGGQFTSNSSQTGTDASGNQFTNSFSATGDGSLPGMLTTQAGPMPTSGGDVYVNLPAPTQTSGAPASGPPDVFNNQGKDVGNYRFGQDELSYLTQNKGQFGISDQIIGDIQKAYAQISQQKGQGAAGMYHYSWIGPGNVQAIPQYANSASDIQMNLP